MIKVLNFVIWQDDKPWLYTNFPHKEEREEMSQAYSTGEVC